MNTKPMEATLKLVNSSKQFAVEEPIDVRIECWRDSKRVSITNASAVYSKDHLGVNTDVGIKKHVGMELYMCDAESRTKVGSRALYFLNIQNPNLKLKMVVFCSSYQRS